MYLSFCIKKQGGTFDYVNSQNVCECILQRIV